MYIYLRSFTKRDINMSGLHREKEGITYRTRKRYTKMEGREDAIKYGRVEG